MITHEMIEGGYSDEAQRELFGGVLARLPQTRAQISRTVTARRLFTHPSAAPSICHGSLQASITAHFLRIGIFSKTPLKAESQ